MRQGEQKSIKHPQMTRIIQANLQAGLPMADARKRQQ
jgi:hypothetical protein